MAGLNSLPGKTDIISNMSPYLNRLLRHALIQPRFDYAFSAWYPNLNKKFKNSENQKFKSE